jgi:hypothetical protein
MAYGTIKVDTITFTDAGVDKSVTISGLVQNPTFSGNITVTGTVSGNTIQGQTVSGATITGGAAAFTTVTGGVATITSGVFALGSASNPSISFNGDANSGLYSPGADQVAVSTGGTGRLFVDASGNVGVGTSSVNALLEVNNSTAGGEVQRIEGNYDGSGSVTLTNWRRAGGSVAAALKYNDDSSPLCMSIGTTTSHEFRIRTADTDAITIDASQRVGIGTSAPQATLHANGAILSSGALVALSASNIFFDQPTSALSRIGVVGANTSTAGALRISQYSSDGSVGRDVFSIDDQGRVGIGTTSPAAPLDVNGAIYSRSTGVYTDAITAYGGSSLAVNAGSSNLNITVNASERARIDSSGRLLVGTSTDTTAKLVVKGSAGSGDDGINVISGSTTAGSKAAIFFSPSSTGSSSTGSAIKTERLSPDGSDLQFYTCTALGSSPTERMRITSAGLVGINTTSPSGQLSVTFNGNSVQGIVATDTGTPGAGNYYLLCGSSGGIQNVASNEIHHSAVSALAFRTGSGNGTERARIDSSGRLLVGTSSASLTNKFLLQGDTSSASNGGYMRLQTTNSIIAGTSLGSIGFGDSANNGALIEAKGDVSWSPFTKGSRLEFSTTADGASSPTERMRITSLGVPRFFSSDTGIISKVAAVAGTAETLFRGSHTATNVLNGTDCIFIRANGNVENTNNSYGAISDIKLKENIVDASPQWDDLKALQVRNYNFKEGQTHTQIGLVAQEVELVSPGLVSESPDRDEEGNDLGTVTKSVNYSVLYMKAVKALQEAMERIETLEQRLNDAGIN